NLKPVVDFDKLKNEREKLTGEKGHVQQEIAELETKSIQRHAKFNGNEESRLMNQKLLNAQIKEALITSQLFFLDTEITYYKTFNSPEKIHYQDNIKPIQAFRRETQDQMNSWEEIASAGMNQISQALITINENNQEERNVTYRETLNLSVSNQALLDALSKKLHHIQLVNNLINERIIETQSTSDQFAFHLNNSWYSLKNSMGNWFYYSLFDIGGVPITIMGIIKAILIILFSFWFSSFISKGTHKFAKGNGKVGEPTLYTFRRIFHYVIILLGILFAFGSLGLTIGNLAIVLGALSIGLGFGLQNIVNNFLCGLAILFERNVKVGDIIELEEGLIGKVMEVNVQNTTLHTFDSLDVLVPNSSVVGKNVINWTKNSSFLRYHVPFQVAYGTDQRLVSEVVSKAALKVDYTITDFPGIPEPDVWLVKFGDSSLHYELIVWIDLYQSKGQKGILAAYLSEIEFALAENNIHIPFPQRDLHIKSVPENMIYSGYQK
ncbi:MAG: mechanosensitive ion channel domain-containing protein, partial [Waddliaceae bacterium]